MKRIYRYFIIVTVMALIITCSACRQVAEGGTIGSSGEETPAQEIENEETTDEGQESNQPADAEDREVEDETKVTETTQSEDGEYSYEAALALWEKLKKEIPDEQERAIYCMDHDIKTFCEVTTDANFELQVVIVGLKNGFSAPGKTAPDFSCVSPIEIKETSDQKEQYTDEDLKEYYQSFKLIIPGKTKEDVLAAIKELEKLEYVRWALPNLAAIPF